jgi:hypothetical protein
MDKEQINELKPGDEILIRGRFEKIKENGDYSISYLLTTVHGKLYMYKAAVHPSAVIIKSPPKHDPTRLFKKGDVVTPRIYLGRKDKGLEMGEKYIVTADEIAGDMVAIKHHFTLRPDIVQTCFLELVTPVEELERYVVEPGDIAWFVVDKKHESGELNVVMYMNTHPNPKAAAEAECKRLNAEWRKELNND